MYGYHSAFYQMAVHVEYFVDSQNNRGRLEFLMSNCTLSDRGTNHGSSSDTNPPRSGGSSPWGTREFLDLTHVVHYPDDYLWVFFHAGLNAHTKSRLPGDGPQGTFLLQQNESPFTVGEVEENLNLPGPRHAHHRPLTSVHGRHRPWVSTCQTEAQCSWPVCTGFNAAFH